MTGNSRSSKMCNQVLRVVKESNLNYLLKETPYSAYVTIRKTFVRDNVEDEALKDTTDNLALSDIALRQENIFLKQKFNGLESEKAQLNIDIEELVIKLEDMTVKNDCLNKKIDLLESEKNSTKIRLEVTKGQFENETEKLEKQAALEKVMASQLKETEIKHIKLEKKAKEMNDEIIMLEHTLKNRDSKIESLNLLMNITSDNHKNICDECNYSCEI